MTPDQILDQIHLRYRQLQRLPGTQDFGRRQGPVYDALVREIRRLSDQYVQALSYRVDRQTPDSTAA
jgi:hypothetical protein